MATYRIQHCFQGGSGSARDRFCNTFYYTSAIPPDTLDVPSGDLYGDLIAGHVRTFYNNLADWYSDECNNPFRTISIYDVAAAPNTPAAYSHVDSTDAFTGKADSVGLPEEVAVVLSFTAVTDGAPRGRRRGRVFIGPLNTDALIAGADSFGPQRVNTSLIGALIDGAGTFKANLAGDDATWCVYSQVDAGAFPVIHVSVDNAFDTMRKRGPVASVTSNAAI